MGTFSHRLISIAIFSSVLLNGFTYHIQKHSYRYSTSDISINGRKLVVWDCDGVLVDSEALLKANEVDALEKLGFQLTVEDCVRLFSGVSQDTAKDSSKNTMSICLWTSSANK